MELTQDQWPDPAELDFSFLDLIDQLIEDPRIERHKRYTLEEVLISAVVAVMCGADTWNAVAVYANHCLEWMQRWLPLKFENGTPSHDTYRRVFSLVDSQQFEQFFARWSDHLRGKRDSKHIAIDGKTVRGSFSSTAKPKSAIHILNAWSTDLGLCLGQVKTKEKSNEIKALPELLDMIRVKGTTITLDALHTQKEIAKKLRKKGANYIFVVKQNQKTLHLQVSEAFQNAQTRNFKRVNHDAVIFEEEGKGRKEIRKLVCMSTAQARKLRIFNIGDQWPNVKSVIKTEYTRIEKAKISQTQIRYFISSREPIAGVLANFIRDHWKVENSLHWSLDVAFREDQSRIRTKNSPQNFAVLRKLALNLIKLDPEKASIRDKRRLCALSPRKRLFTLLPSVNRVI